MKLDFHSHILPGLDDGAQDINESLMLVQALKDMGFENIEIFHYYDIVEDHKPISETAIKNREEFLEKLRELK